MLIANADDDDHKVFTRTEIIHALDSNESALKVNVVVQQINRG